MLTNTTESIKVPNVQPQLTEGIYLTGDEALLQFVIDYYYRRYAKYFSMEGTLPDSQVSYSYSIPSSPKLKLAPLPPQVQAGRSNMLCTVESIELGITTSKGSATFQARADILATCVLAGPQRLMVKVDKAVATTEGQVDPVASQVLEKAVVPALVKWLESLLLPELTQVIWDRLLAQVLTATVEAGQINAYARVFGEGQTSALGAALPPTDMTAVPGAGRVRAVIREDVLTTALAILTPNGPFTAKDKAGCSGFSGEVIAKASLADPVVDISGDRLSCKFHLKASVEVKGKALGVGTSIKLKGSCDVKPVISLKKVGTGEKVVIAFDVKRSDLNVDLDGDWGALDFARKSLNKTVNAMLDEVLDLAAKFFSTVELPAFDLTRLANSMGLKVDVTADEVGFRDNTLYGQFTIREQN